MPTQISLRNQFGVIRILVIASSVIVLCSCRAITMSSTGFTGTDCQESLPGACHSHSVDGSMNINVPQVTLPRPAVPCPICDGGDQGAPARPVGENAIGNLTMGDTVARYRIADGTTSPDDICVAVSNRTCVYSPKFASVRQISLPSERSVLVGVRGMAQEEPVAAEVRLDPIRDNVQNLTLESTRRTEIGLGVEEKLGLGSVGQLERSEGTDKAEKPSARIADVHVAHARRQQSLTQLVGFVVPAAWTRIRAVNVCVNDLTPQTVSSEEGTATLRFEQPGRAELTISKQAGSNTARIGEELDFTIFILNSGDRTLEDIVLVDALPDRLVLLQDSPSSSLSADISTENASDGSVVLKWHFLEPLVAGDSGFVRFRTVVR